MSTVARRLGATGLGVFAVAVLALGTCVLTAAPAGAAGGGHVRIDIAGSPGGFSAHPSGPLVDTAGLVPGSAASGAMGVQNGFGGPSDLSLVMIDVVNDDNGCTHAESVIDQTCGAGQGELGAELVFTLAVAPSESGTYVSRWTGTAAQLEHGVPAAVGIGAGDARWVRLTASLPFAAGNEVQSDQFGFGVRVVLQNSAGVEGIDIGRTATGTGTAVHGGAGHGVLGLAVTGTQAALLAALGALFVGCGLFLLGAARRRRRSA